MATNNDGALAMLAGFGDFDPMLIAPDQNNRVTACLRALASHPQADNIFAAAGDMNMQDDFWPASDSWQASIKPYVVKAGVLQIPVKGVLLHNFPFAIGSYATGYYYIQKALERGLSDPDVKGIALVCDSPGGHVAGCFELSDRIHAARSMKPIAAFAHEHAFSAAYAVASAASRVTVSKTGGVGSIGVVTMHVDFSKQLDNAGIKVTFIFAGKHKVDGNPYEALSDDAKARIQARINDTYGVFVGAVAKYRKLDEKKVRAAGALTFTSSEAVDQGLADRVGPLDDALAEFATCLLGNDGEDTMTDQAKPGVAQADHDAAVAAAGATAKAAERKRIADIKASDAAKDRPIAAESVAMNTELSVEAAVAFLGTLPKETAAKTTNAGDPAFASRMAAQGAGPAADLEGAEEEETALTADQRADAEAERLLAARFGPRTSARK